MYKLQGYYFPKQWKRSPKRCMASTLARQGIGPVLGHTQLADLAAAL
jgi:hypothetical protein